MNAIPDAVSTTSQTFPLIQRVQASPAPNPAVPAMASAGAAANATADSTPAVVGMYLPGANGTAQMPIQVSPGRMHKRALRVGLERSGFMRMML